LILRRLRPEDVRAVEQATGVAIDHVSVQVMARPGPAPGVGELV
jgi:hypothetical protein